MEQIELYERLIKAYDRIKELEEENSNLRLELADQATSDMGNISDVYAAAELLMKENSALRAEIDSLKGKRESKGLPFLRSWLESKGIKQKEAADLCGVSGATISRACSGYRLERPSVAKIVSGLGLSDEEAKEMYRQTRRKNGKPRRG